MGAIFTMFYGWGFITNCLKETVRNYKRSVRLLSFSLSDKTLFSNYSGREMFALRIYLKLVLKSV